MKVPAAIRAQTLVLRILDERTTFVIRTYISSPSNTVLITPSMAWSGALENMADSSCQPTNARIHGKAGPKTIRCRSRTML